MPVCPEEQCAAVGMAKAFGGGCGVHSERRHQRAGRMAEPMEVEPRESGVVLRRVADCEQPDALTKAAARPGFSRHRWKYERCPSGAAEPRRRRRRLRLLAPLSVEHSEARPWRTCLCYRRGLRDLGGVPHLDSTVSVELVCEREYFLPLALADHVAKKLDARLRRRLAHPCMRGAAQALARRNWGIVASGSHQ